MVIAIGECFPFPFYRRKRSAFIFSGSVELAIYGLRGEIVLSIVSLHQK